MLKWKPLPLRQPFERLVYWHPTDRFLGLGVLVRAPWRAESFVRRESFSEHGPLAYRLFFGRFILNNIPVLDEDPILNAHNICGNPIHWSTETAKSPVHDHEVSLSHDRSRFVLQRWWEALNPL